MGWTISHFCNHLCRSNIHPYCSRGAIPVDVAVSYHNEDMKQDNHMFFLLACHSRHHQNSLSKMPRHDDSNSETRYQLDTTCSLVYCTVESRLFDRGLYMSIPRSVSILNFLLRTPAITVTLDDVRKYKKKSSVHVRFQLLEFPPTTRKVPPSQPHTFQHLIHLLLEIY